MAVRILYVEDEEFLGKIVRESLESRGFEVVMETDGARVMTKFRNASPDICILDVMLPNKDGFEIAEEIRKINPSIPIIFLTAKVQTNDVVKGFTIGGNDYIRKPFSMEELIVRIANALKLKNDGGAENPKEELHIGRYLFHPHRQTLSFNNEDRKLSFRESELLRLLLNSRDKIIDRRDILNVLWGNDSFFNSRNLDVYVAKLRSYLKEDESLEIITIKGVGYRFVTG
ncbi:response regulator transcription factor [Pollutibacter soli]|uniref:response regulator transcription factor n=1 Tax=Pollutibacter soli TaxID=3034157 RepID=UPI0030139373